MERIWALPPEVISGGDFSPFDLNVEYKPADEAGRNREGDKENIPTLANESSHPIEKSMPFCIEGGRENVKEKKILLEESSSSIGNTNSEENYGGRDWKDALGSESSEQLPEAVQDCGECEKLSVGNEGNQLVREGIESKGAEEVEEEDDGILCAVCESTDGNPSDPTVFCDRCDVMVHARCYGNPLIKEIPEGDWFCNQCLASSVEKKGKPFSCCLCPVKGGAMKPTNDGRWTHVEDPEGREGIDCSKVPKRRWEGKCYVCNSRKGCVIECSEPKCWLAFHVTCALKADLCIEYKEGKKGTVIAGFCKSHTELWKKQQETGKFKIVAKNEI